jgi:hypothetical protein
MMSFKSKTKLDKINFIRYLNNKNELDDNLLDIKEFLLEHLFPLHFSINNVDDLWKVIQYLKKTHVDFLEDEYFKNDAARVKFILKHGDPAQRITLLNLNSSDSKLWKKLTQIVKNDDSEAFQELKRLEKLAKTEYEE